MPKEQRVEDRDGVPPRERTDPGEVAAGDAELSAAPSAAERPVPPHEELVGPESEPTDEQLQALQREFASLSDRHLRLAAEFDNYRRRSERERGELWSRAQADLAARLLDPLDDLDRVADHADRASMETLLDGMKLVERKLRQTLQSAGLEPLPAQGARFDPNSMEAVAMIGTDSADEDDVVADVFQQGYRFKGSLLRPARVRVKKLGA
jgi:molecular chaperone GrpE